MRYLPLTTHDSRAMLADIGVDTIEDLFVDVPSGALLAKPIVGLANHADEMTVERYFSRLARQNMAAADHPFFLGAGAYRHHIPASVDHLIQRGEFLTAYTPYQPEIAQGTLQTLFEFQTQVARLFGCDVANASMYDGSTACWEAIRMAARVTRRKRALLASGLHPHYISVAATMAQHSGDTLVSSPPSLDADMGLTSLTAAITGETSAIVVQYPDILGRIGDLSELAGAAHEQGALLIAVVTEPVALGAIKSPGEMGADIVVGEGQALGIGLQFGGPYVGLFACKKKFIRQMPGRLCGETIDSKGKRSFVLTLATREQHIRREKATSNICTNAGLCALAFSIHLTLLGERGLRDLAALNHARALEVAERLTKIADVSLVNESFFNEFTVVLPVAARPVVHELAAKGVLAGVSLGRLYPGDVGLENGLVLAVTEMVSDEDIDALVTELDLILSSKTGAPSQTSKRGLS